MLSTTVVSDGSIRPASMSFFVTPTVTPPAVSAKMPSVRASSLIASTTCSSFTSSTAPPVRRAMSRTYGPSAGLPMARDLAIVFGFCGRTTSWPPLYATETGEQPSAWAPKSLYGLSSTRPSLISSWRPLSILVNCEPDAIGMTSWSGSRQPSCSQISYARVLEPSP